MSLHQREIFIWFHILNLKRHPVYGNFISQKKKNYKIQQLDIFYFREFVLKISKDKYLNT